VPIARHTVEKPKALELRADLVLASARVLIVDDWI